MKYLATILSLYILILTGIPCLDGSNDDAVQNNQISQTTNNTSPQSDVDYCSPFCVCSCCISPIIHQVYVLSLYVPTFTHFNYTGYSSVFISSLPVSIWQPPKLA